MNKLLNVLNPITRYNFVELALAGDIPEEPAGGLSDVLGGGGGMTFGGLERILAGIGRAGSIHGILLKVSGLNIGIARANTIRMRLLDLRKRGKRVIVYLEGGGNIEYLIASAGECIYIPKWATLNVIGLGAEVTFLKDTLGKLGIEAHISGLGKYKSAGDMFTRDSISDAHREMIESILGNLEAGLESAIAAGRGIEPEKIGRILDRAPFVAEAAVSEGLADGIAYEDEMAERASGRAGFQIKTITSGRYYKYLKVCDALVSAAGRITGRGAVVAVLSATGTVTGGRSRGNGGMKTMGSGSLTKMLGRIAGDKRVKALVLRISTPGGSGPASDLIRHKLRLLSEKIPVVVSMSDVAASGGYMIALGAGKVVADPMSLTGSIGILSGKFNIRGLNEKIGLRKELFPTAGKSLMYSSSRGFSEDEDLKLKEILRFYYDAFVKSVSERRGMDTEDAEKSAGGRVWTGAQAKELGLVDELGGLYEAVRIAGKESGLPEWSDPLVRYYYESRGFKLSSLFRPNAYMEALGGILDYARSLSRENYLAVMPFKIDVG